IDIQQKEVRASMLQHIEALARRGKGRDFPAVAFQNRAEFSAAGFVRFDDDNFFVSVLHESGRLSRIRRSCTGREPAFGIRLAPLASYYSRRTRHNSIV